MIVPATSAIALALRLATFMMILQWFSAAAANGQEPTCTPLSEHGRDRVTTYVRALFNFPHITSVTLEHTGAALPGCYRPLVYILTMASGSYAPFVAFVSPDENSIVREVLDITRDPQQTEEHAAVQSRRLALTEESTGNEVGINAVVVFSDFTCPYCKSAGAAIKTLRHSEEQDKQVIRIRHFPQPQHPWASQAAELSACISQIGGGSFWKFYDAMFDSQQELKASSAEVATQRMWDIVDAIMADSLPTVRQCVTSGEGRRSVKKDMILGALYGVKGTPTTFFNGIQLKGAATSEQFADIILKEANRIDKNELSTNH